MGRRRVAREDPQVELLRLLEKPPSPNPHTVPVVQSNVRDKVRATLPSITFSDSHPDNIHLKTAVRWMKNAKDQCGISSPEIQQQFANWALHEGIIGKSHEECVRSIFACFLCPPHNSFLHNIMAAYTGEGKLTDEQARDCALNALAKCILTYDPHHKPDFEQCLTAYIQFALHRRLTNGKSSDRRQRRQ